MFQSLYRLPRLFKSGSPVVLLAVLLSLPVISSPATEQAATEERSATAEEFLLDLVLRQNRLFELVEERPDLLSEAELERRIQSLLEDYGYYHKTYPGDAMALILNGKLLMAADLRERAIQLFLQADAINPDIAVVKQQIGNYFAEENRGLAALPFIFRAVDLEPEEPIYHYQLGELLAVFREEFIDEGVMDAAALDLSMQTAFRRAADLQPASFDLQMRYGESFYDVASPDWTAALEHWQKMEEAFPEVFQEQVILLHQGRVLIELNCYEEALGALQYVRHSALRTTRDNLLERIPPDTVAPALD